MLNKFLSILVSVFIFTGNFTSIASASEKPFVEKFSISKDELDLFGTNMSVDFELVMSHQAGISNQSAVLVLTNSTNNSISTVLNRTDKPINFSNKQVNFQGSLVIPRNLNPGVYTYSVEGISSNLLNGVKIDSGKIIGPKIRNLKGAESGILIRSNGYLDLNYSGLNGPSYGSQFGKSYEDAAKFLSTPAPIWRVNEIFDPSKYFEIVESGSKIELSSNTPRVCITEGTVLKLLSTGECTYTITLPRSKNYISKTIMDTVSISGPRLEQVLFIESVPNLSATNLPITLRLNPVYSSGLSAAEYLYPTSVTPLICEPSQYTVRIFGGGTCTLNYQSSGNSNYLPSKVYTQTINIDFEKQVISFELPSTLDVKLGKYQLSAKSSSSANITYSTNSTGICSTVNSELILLKAGQCSVTATQVGSPTLAPASITRTLVITGTTAVAKKTITCISGKKSKKVSGANPKCPKGYKLKK